MIGSVATSRRANAFAQALDERTLDEATAADEAAGDAPPGPEVPEGAPGTPDTPGAPATPPAHREEDGTADGGAEQSLLLTLAEGLEALPRPELDPEVKTVQRAQLVAAMESAFAEGTASAAGDAGRLPEQRGGHSGKGSHRAPSLGPLGKLRPKSRLAKGLTAGGLGVGVAASALGGVAAASSDALPGESLYGVKRGMEDLRLDLAGEDTDRGQLHLDNASTRLMEARRLMERGRSGSLDHESLGEIRKTLSGMRYDATEGHRLLSAAYERDGDIAPMRSLSSFSKSHRASWSQLRDRLPVQLTDVGDDVSSVFDAIDSDVGPIAGLFRATPEETGTGTRPGTDRRTAQSDSASPSESPSTSGGKEGVLGGGSGEPEPSESRQQEDGLLGGGGLLDPPKDPDQKPSVPGPDDEAPKLPDADVTLPPIVPEILPGLNDLSGGGGRQ